MPRSQTVSLLLGLVTLSIGCSTPGSATPDSAVIEPPTSDHPAALTADASLAPSQDTGADAPIDAPIDVPIDAGPPPDPVEAWVPMRARWRYLDDGREPPTAWRGVDFDDGAWRAGEAQLGYGDGDEATVVSSGPDAARRYVTTWFRRRFEVRGRDGVQRVLLRLLRDDGAVVHINGREVHRSNLPTGPIGPGTLAAETVGGLAEDAFEEVMLDPALLREGTNVVAVEVHQATVDSSDLGFDLALIGYRADAGPAPGGDPVLLAAGDIARCDGTDDDATARLLDGLGGTIATLGDSVYESGTDREFRDCYGPTWGRHRARTRPAVGNHEYNTPGAAGYYRYFGAAAGRPTEGWYSYELGAWHVVVLNSNCASVGGCNAGSPQERWLRADLAAHPARCTLAAWHHPRFSGGNHGDDPQYTAFWRALEDAGAELIINGHDHDYERFAPRRSDGARDDRGLREFVVGTGGTRLLPIERVAPESEGRNASAHGVLQLTLHPDGYDWRFVPIAGAAYTDSGRGACR
ncbi:MAG: metallophosphoesterase [Myxococcales bacterium]|nr:metallophosphoesterase [Myxococcales bacterium]